MVLLRSHHPLDWSKEELVDMFDLGMKWCVKFIAHINKIVVIKFEIYLHQIFTVILKFMCLLRALKINELVVSLVMLKPPIDGLICELANYIYS